MEEVQEKDVMPVTGFIKLYPKYRERFENLEWTTKTVGHAYDYDSTVYSGKLHALYGSFIGLFIRKCLCTRLGKDCIDSKAITVLGRKIEIPGLRNKLTCAYTRYTDIEEKAIDIVKDIKVVALSHRMFYHEPMANLNNTLNMRVNYENLKEIVQYIDSLPYESFLWQEGCDFEFDTIQFSGCVDYLFDNNIFCQVATSKYEDSYKNKVTQLVFYTLSHYGRNYYETGEDHTYELMVYNPLLNKVYTTRFDMNKSVYEEMRAEIEIDGKRLFAEDEERLIHHIEKTTKMSYLQFMQISNLEYDRKKNSV